MAGIAAFRDTMICRMERNLLKSRKTRNALSNRRVLTPLDDDAYSAMRLTSTTTVSNQFHPSDTNCQNQFDTMLTESSKAKMSEMAVSN
eukprot:763521-Hanusia_phi.AAC.21